MSLGLRPAGAGPSFVYAGNEVRIVAGEDGDGPVSMAELVIPAGFQGPIPHAHDTFDEMLYVLDGVILAGVGYDDPAEAGVGALLTATRGTRHFFSNPFDEPARVLGLWSPAGVGLDFMRVIGAALPAAGPPDPDVMAALYEANGSRLLP